MTLKRWLPTFLAFPLGGLLALETVGAVTDPASAAAAGLLAGAVIGAGQWLALRGAAAASTAAGRSSPQWRWRRARRSRRRRTTHAGTDVADLILTGAVTGAAVGAAQAALLGREVSGRRSPPRAGRWRGSCRAGVLAAAGGQRLRRLRLQRRARRHRAHRPGAPSRGARVSLAGLVLIVLPVAFNVAFGMLAARFDYRTSCAGPPARCSRGSARAAGRSSCLARVAAEPGATSASRSASTSGTY